MFTYFRSASVGEQITDTDRYRYMTQQHKTWARCGSVLARHPAGTRSGDRRPVPASVSLGGTTAEKKTVIQGETV